MFAVKELYRSHKIKIFEDLTEAEFSLISKFAEDRTYNDGATIIEENEKDIGLFIIIKGKVHVVKTNPENQEFYIATLSEGDCFGEMALFTGEKHIAKIRAIGTITVKFLSKAKFDKFIQQNLAIGLKLTTRMLKIVSDRLRHTNEELIGMLNLAIISKDFKNINST